MYLQERIGVVKKMLLAHSKVFRKELHESPLKEKNNTEIKDIFPDTFKNLLRYIAVLVCKVLLDKE